ncbi:hypothetical protein BDN72DRAFT_189548 [Pluteus cervinus]|uniref:Uncharacterized protein n=1 Tax=Pluteus cervinus TaxID=181527 RepID=A0ACD3AI93_9AGAR|nr:hypothetical protein BDN72DRAFT_189548 [Pluteus cervinus]
MPSKPTPITPRKRKKSISQTNEIWDVLASAKSKKGKERANPTNSGSAVASTQKDLDMDDDGPCPAPESISASPKIPIKHPKKDKPPLSLPARAPSTRSSGRLAQLQLSAPPAPIPRPSQPSTDISSPIAPKFNIKKVKLIVRQPPPLLSSPLHRAPVAKFASLDSFFDTYKTLNDKDADDAILQAKANADAKLLDRIDRFRKDGLLVPRPPGMTSQTLWSTPPTGLLRTSRDIWDQIIASVVVIGKLKVKRPMGKYVAAQVAAKVQGYWDGYATRQDKVRLQEERRVRALAKATMKTVTNEWKKAVFHIREQERLKLEAEELKRGAEHLDAILNQSGQILETQQGDLTKGDYSRSRSRSASVSEVFGEWGPPDSDDEHSVDGEEREGDEAQNEGETTDAEDEGDTTMMDVGQERDVDPGGAELTGDSDDEDEIVPAAAEHDMEDEDEDATTALLLGGTQASSPSPSGPEVSEPSASAPTTPRSEGNRDDADIARDDSSTIAGDTHLQGDIEGSHPSPPITQPSKASSPDPLAVSMSPEGDSDPLLGVELEVASPNSLFSAPLGEDEVMQIEESQDEATEEHVVNSKDREEETPVDEGEPADDDPEATIPEYLKPYAVTPVKWDPNTKVRPPLLLRGILRPYQQSGLEWLTSLHTNHLNGILADEMGLGKTIQTISLLAHLACDQGIWGPHLIIVPTSVLLNWEMEFKKFLPGFKILSYHGSGKRRKELRQGWNDKHHFNVCITSYTLASRDAHIFKRKAWYYMVLDEAHMIKNFKSQRWNTLLMFRSFRRLLLTGTPLQNNLTELWALLQFLMSGANFANLKEFGEWFSNPLEKAIESGNALDDDTMQRVTKLHTVLRPYLLRRLKRDVEKELPSKFEHLVLCPLSKRQRYLYDEFMSRAQTRDALQSGVYQKVANILMQLRKVCNHPDLFEVRPIVTSFAMQRSAIADFEIKELLVRRRLLQDEEEPSVNFDFLGLRFVGCQGTSQLTALETKRLDASSRLSSIPEAPGEPQPKDLRTIDGFRRYTAYMRKANAVDRWAHIAYLNRIRCQRTPIFSEELLRFHGCASQPLLPSSYVKPGVRYLDTVKRVNELVVSYEDRAMSMAETVDRFAFVTPAVVALDLPRITLKGQEDELLRQDTNLDAVLHRPAVKLQIAFPDPSLLQYDCGKLQELTRLLREKKAGGHRVLIFTQMTRILDILETFLNYHGYLYLRLDGATKIEDRQYITERFNADARVFCFIASSRSGGVGINLTGADTVIFYDSDFNPQMDRQCEDRAHRIGQIRDVHIYRFVSQHSVEEAMLHKANQKRSLDDLVIQKGEFDWRSLFDNETALTKALEEYEDREDALAAKVAAREECEMEGANLQDFGEDGEVDGSASAPPPTASTVVAQDPSPEAPEAEPQQEEEDQDGTVVEYMLAYAQRDWEFFKDWKV